MKGLSLSKSIRGLVKEMPHLQSIDRLTTNDLPIIRSIIYEQNRIKSKDAPSQKYLKTGELFSMILLGDIYQNIFEKHHVKRRKHTHSKTHEIAKQKFKYYLFSKNPSLEKYLHLFVDDAGNSDKREGELGLRENFFKEEDNELIDFLLKPIKLNPYSLKNQLEYMYDNWKEYLGDEELLLLKALDLLKEEEKWGLAGPGEFGITAFFSEWNEPQNFSPDKDWMPSLVLLAKNIFVWLDQLTERYKREIKTLDQIPDEEFELLAQSGFTGLWLIGIWERSNASKRIKHLTGNFDALASAYSLKRYNVSASLGGEESLRRMTEKAWKYGIRIGCDMVPNHMAIDSDWVYDHPEWFIQTDNSPFPSYSFSGENLSDHPDVEIYIEDHYYDHKDAAVVFKYVDHRDGRTRYIYHGNDGTCFPWNDTAQLNYLLPHVREAVINEIVHIAKKFPIIRFDAAMTLSKKHFQRLWYPEPGTGGDIPSRSEFSMSKEEFNKRMPKEFWREVVDRTAFEAPDTLLLAEAFWLMEGYFVRTLGMHRVYNSAFMNMMKNEENSKYRQSIKNVLEFDPQILKRFVNFMSNPDEDTAVEQFGFDDKYFGTCVLMSTLPGLPMFAHGQVQGFRERYGMEFHKPRWSEKENIGLIERHKKEIFPLLRRRHFFSDVRNFYLYDFTANNGTTNENVFVYSNEYYNVRTLVIFNNKYEETTGHIKWSYFAERNQNGESVWKKKSIADIFSIPDNGNTYVVFRDVIKDWEYIRHAKDILNHGLFQELSAFAYAVFSDFRIYYDEDGVYSKIASTLENRGVRNIEQERKKITNKEMYDALDLLLSDETFQQMFNFSRDESLMENIMLKVRAFLQSIEPKDDDLYDLNILIQLYEKDIRETISLFEERFTISHDQFYVLFIWLMLRRTGMTYKKSSYPHSTKDFIEDFDLENFLREKINVYTQSDLGKFYTKLIKIIASEHKLWKYFETETCYDFLKQLFDIEEIKVLLEFNWFDNILWFRKEAFDEFFILLEITQTIRLITTTQDIDREFLLEKNQNCFNKIRKAYAFSDFKVEQLLEGLK
ncbi:MAG: hypothetical protein JW794_10365 [Candidatus Cloacimonetes bacterium]|nr:hypothetical protein [Candidatus Cloacimonadota bacterium]